MSNLPAPGSHEAALLVRLLDVDKRVLDGASRVVAEFGLSAHPESRLKRAALGALRYASLSRSERIRWADELSRGCEANSVGSCGARGPFSLQSERKALRIVMELMMKGSRTEAPRAAVVVVGGVGADVRLAQQLCAAAWRARDNVVPALLRSHWRPLIDESWQTFSALLGGLPAVPPVWVGFPASPPSS